MKSIIFFVRLHFLPTFAVSKGNKELTKKFDSSFHFERSLSDKDIHKLGLVDCFIFRS